MSEAHKGIKIFENSSHVNNFLDIWNNHKNLIWWHEAFKSNKNFPWEI